jgi:hypothetical protein
MTGSARVLNGLMERRALESAFAALAETTSVDELAERSQAIAQHGNAAIPVLLSLLDTSDPQLRGGLGQVAARLEPEQIVPALRTAARSRERTDQARLTALMILDRFLHEPVDEALLAGLQDPDTVAAQSLRELVHEMERNQFVVIEYLNQLAEQPADVALTVIEAIPAQPSSPHLITLLRMFAQGEDRRLAQTALEQLSRTRAPEAVQALASLAAALPPAQAAVAARRARKLRLSGVAEPAAEDAAPTTWRALLSPIDGSGAQVTWFVGLPEGEDQGTLFSILCKDPDGIVGSFGSRHVPVADLPPAQPLGDVYLVRQTEDTAPIMLLEVPLGDGQRTVREALERNWASGHLPPMEYRLLNLLISAEMGEIERGTEVEPEIPDWDLSAAVTPARCAALLDHPAFATWFWQAPELYDAAQRLGRRHSLVSRGAQVRVLAENHFGPDVLDTYRRRLAGMARWLTLASQPEAAALAGAAAAQLAGEDGAGNPFVHRLIAVGLDVAIANLRSGFDLRRHAAASG